MNLFSAGWEEVLKKQLLNPLPGSIAHEPLRAFPANSRDFNFKNEGPPRPGAVLILMWAADKNEDTVTDRYLIRFPLIRRSETGGVHSGQISLPGGRSEEGEDPVFTAIREAEEEIGISRDKIEILGSLSPFHVIPSHYMVTPVVARLNQNTEPVFIKQDNEVAEIIFPLLHHLLPDDAIRYTELNVRGYSVNAPHFFLEGQIVWGATAMILNELRMVMKEAFRS
ncbi:MAG: NUDIX hydrolase [Cyclobacteriaceae bacterium]